jgi:protein tyrosine/serine phosphatase
MGIRTDISLLGAGKANQKQLVDAERIEAQKAGLNFVNLEVPFHQPPKALIDRFMATVKNPANQPVFVHCKRGRDRTGVMIAAYRILSDGLSGKEALAEMQSFGYEPKQFPYYTELVLQLGPN